MELREFLQAVTDDGLRCIAVKTEVGFMQLPATDVEQAERLVRLFDSKKQDVYFALATFREEHLNDNGKRRVSRKRKNVDKIKALWLDIDFKDCDRPALELLNEFLIDANFPKPSMIVNSGNGLHVYWPLSEGISHEEWLPLSKALKEKCVDYGLPADHACTADASRVLRPISTHNWKNPEEPKPVKYAGGSGSPVPLKLLQKALGADSVKNALPAHLRKAAATDDGSEFVEGAGRPQNIRNVFRNCGVLRSILETGGRDQSEPEWSATLNILAHLDGGEKFVHKMSEGHPDYSEAAATEKWEQKKEAVEDGTGPTLCRTFESFYEDICKACPFYRSKKIKTPKSLAYMDEPGKVAPEKVNVPKLVAAKKAMAKGFPKGWRLDGNGYGMERKVWDAKEKQEVWEPALRHIWYLSKATRNIRERDYYVTLVNNHQGNISEFDFSAGVLGSTSDLTRTLATYGAPISDPKELQNFKALMTTWLDQLRATNNVEDTTDQLGWIEEVADEQSETIGFACGSHAYYRDGTERAGVVAANSKHKGIVQSFEPVGNIVPWREAVDFLAAQGCDHLITMVASAFAGPLIRFTGQNGAVLSVVSEDSGAGKSTGMSVAQAVWGDPANAPATIQDTPTVVKNKIAYLQNITAYWDEVRGDDAVMGNFVQIAFQVSQGRDRERANSSAETIRAQTWKTMLVTASNESLYDIAAGKLGESDAGVYRIYELKVGKDEFPEYDPVIGSAVVDLTTNFGHAGKLYAKWLADNYERLLPEVQAMRTRIEEAVKAKSPERFWIATITAVIMGATFANEAKLTNFDIRRLTKYLVEGLMKLRTRTLESRTQLSPRELVAAFAQQHQDGKVTVDQIPMGRGRQPQPTLQGNHNGVRKVSYVVSSTQQLMRVLKSDFLTWLKKSKNLRWSDKLQDEFRQEVGMTEIKAQLAAGTSFSLSRAMCLTFDIESDVEEVNDENQDASISGRPAPGEEEHSRHAAEG